MTPELLTTPTVCNCALSIDHLQLASSEQQSMQAGACSAVWTHVSLPPQPSSQPLKPRSLYTDIHTWNWRYDRHAWRLQGSICWLAMCRLQQAISKQYGASCARAFMIVTALQFHLPFYMSRTLPNTFALAVLGLAIADWVEARHPRRLISLLAFATVRLPVSILYMILTFACQSCRYPSRVCVVSSCHAVARHGS